MKNIIKDKDFPELAITYGYNKIFSNKIIKNLKWVYGIFIQVTY